MYTRLCSSRIWVSFWTSLPIAQPVRLSFQWIDQALTGSAASPERYCGNWAGRRAPRLATACRPTANSSWPSRTRSRRYCTGGFPCCRCFTGYWPLGSRLCSLLELIQMIARSRLLRAGWLRPRHQATLALGRSGARPPTQNTSVNGNLFPAGSLRLRVGRHCNHCRRSPSICCSLGATSRPTWDFAGRSLSLGHSPPCHHSLCGVSQHYN